MRLADGVLQASHVPWQLIFPMPAAGLYLEELDFIPKYVTFIGILGQFGYFLMSLFQILFTFPQPHREQPCCFPSIINGTLTQNTWWFSYCIWTPEGYQFTKPTLHAHNWYTISNFLRVITCRRLCIYYVHMQCMVGWFHKLYFASCMVHTILKFCIMHGTYNIKTWKYVLF